MTYGDLLDALDEIKQAELELNKARMAVLHGGNEDTMRWKHQQVEHFERCVAELRARPLPGFFDS